MTIFSSIQWGGEFSYATAIVFEDWSQYKEGNIFLYRAYILHIARPLNMSW